MAATSSDSWHGVYHCFAIYNPSASAVVANIGLTCTRRLSGGLGGFKAISPKKMIYNQSYHSGVAGPFKVELEKETLTWVSSATTWLHAKLAFCGNDSTQSYNSPCLLQSRMDECPSLSVFMHWGVSPGLQVMAPPTSPRTQQEKISMRNGT